MSVPLLTSPRRCCLLAKQSPSISRKVLYIVLMLPLLKFPLFCCVTTLFFFSVNHFDGILQDCMLYTMQAINFIAPERFAGDVAFTLGTQHHYTLFPQLYAPFILLLPIDKGVFFFSVLNHGFIAFSIAVLVWRWCKRFHCLPLALPIALLFISLYSYGESRGVFSLTMRTIEAFPVPRSLSAGFGFIGLAFFFERKKTSLILFIIGTLIHPLTCGWALPLWTMYYFPRTRLPIAIVSILFPLTALIGVGSLSINSEISTRPSWHGAQRQQIIEMSCYLAFFSVALIKMKMPVVLRQITQPFVFILGIAVYLYCTDLLFHHDFIHQVQVFRIQWIYQILTMFVFAFVLFRLYLIKIRKKKKINLWDKFFLLMACSLYADCLFLLVFALLLFVCSLIKFKKASQRGLLCSLVGIVIYFCMWIARLQPCLKPEYVYATDLIVMTRLLAASAAIALFLGSIEPRYRSALCAILSVPIFFIISVGHIFPKENLSFPFLLSSFIWLFPYQTFTRAKNIKRVGLCILVGLLSTCVISRYDNRPADLREKELAINQFVAQPPFPDVKNRGQILFAERDFGEEVPRLRYLSGSYYDFQISVGGVFSKALKEETDSREWKIFGGDQPVNSNWKNLSPIQRANMAFSILFDKDSLQKRFCQLCEMQEISHLVTDFRYPIPAKDSLTLWYNKKKIFLYPCSF